MVRLKRTTQKGMSAVFIDGYFPGADYYTALDWRGLKSPKSRVIRPQEYYNRIHRLLRKAHPTERDVANVYSSLIHCARPPTCLLHSSETCPNTVVVLKTGDKFHTVERRLRGEIERMFPGAVEVIRQEVEYEHRRGRTDYVQNIFFETADNPSSCDFDTCVDYLTTLSGLRPKHESDYMDPGAFEQAWTELLDGYWLPRHERWIQP